MVSRNSLRICGPAPINHAFAVWNIPGSPVIDIKLVQERYILFQSTSSGEPGPLISSMYRGTAITLRLITSWSSRRASDWLDHKLGSEPPCTIHYFQN